MQVYYQACVCGHVTFESTGDPILSGVCYCDDCRAGGLMLEALPDAAPALDLDGGADYLAYRDDCYRCVAGEGLLKGHKLRETSPSELLPENRALT